MSNEVIQETTPLVECSAFHRGMSVLEASLRNTEDSESIISGLLKGAAEFYGASRASVVEADWDLGIGVITYEWCKDGVPAQRDKVIELPSPRFQQFSRALLADYDFIAENKNAIRHDDDARYCLLILDAEGKDGFLVDPQGHNYARYSAFVPNARSLLTPDMGIDRSYLSPAEPWRDESRDEMLRITLRVNGKPDYASRYAFPLSVPTSRGSQLRTVAHLCAEAQDTSESELTKAVCEKLKVSSKSAEALLKEYRTLCCARQLGDDVFSVSCGGDPAVAYDRLMRRTLLMQRMEEVLTPRELNLVRSYLGIGQPDEVGMTFQELAIRLNYNGPSGVEKAYKAALRKLKKDLYGGAYGRWLSAQKAINKARAEAEADPGHYTTPQTTWLDEKELMERFICEVVSLIRVHEIFSDALENIAAKIFEES